MLGREPDDPRSLAPGSRPRRRPLTVVVPDAGPHGCCQRKREYDEWDARRCTTRRSARCCCGNGSTPGDRTSAKASELYHDEVVLEFPQSDQWFRGKANQQGWRERYPAKLDFQPREIRGSGDLWIAEGVLS